MNCAIIIILAAEWIGAPSNDAPALSKTFSTSQEINRARLTIVAPCFYEAQLDGVKIGDRVLDPSPTDYTKRVYSTEYQLSLQPGNHELKVLLGHGWYDQRTISAWDNHLDKWRDEPCVKAELQIAYKNGAHGTIGTDSSWKQVKSPLAWDDFREGEIIDPSGFLPRKGMGENAVVVKGPAGKVCPADFPPARVKRTIQPKRVWRPKAGGWILDFGEDLAGWARMIFRSGKRGEVVTIRYDERIQPNGEPTIRVERKDIKKIGRKELWPDYARVIDCYTHKFGSTNILAGAAMQQDRFVLTGNAEDHYEPRFTYKGFRYVWVQGIEALPDAVACEVRTDFEEIGAFECSDANFNSLMLMTDRSYKANFTDGVPTDCPHREKNGWTGDAGVACEYAQYAYDNTAAYVKWIRDVVDSQRADGNLSGVIPTGGWGFNGKGYGAAWGSAVAFIPWMVYTYRDNDEGLKTALPAIEKFIAYQLAQTNVQGLVCHGLGDWISNGYYTDEKFAGTAYLYGIIRIAAMLKPQYTHMAEELRDRFNRIFYKGNGVYGNGHQAEQALALTFGIVDESERLMAEAKLIEAVEKAGGKFEGGVLGSKHILRALSRAGRTDLAFAMLKVGGEGGFQHWRERGGTALWEDWWTGFSRNHIMFGDFACWAYQYLAGIRLPEGDNSTAAMPNPKLRGFRSVVIAPDCIGSLDFVKASVKTPRGMIASEWRRECETTMIKVRVPSDTEARIILPGVDAFGKREYLKGTGEYQFFVTKGIEQQ